MQYKTIVLELLQQRPEIHDQLRSQRMLLPTMEHYASELKDPPRGLEGAPLPGEAGEQREPDRERGPGDRPQGTGGLFASRVAAGRERTACPPRRSNGVPPPSHAARVKASRQPLLDFDAPPAPTIPFLLSPARGLERRHGNQPAGPGKRTIGSP